MDSGIKSKPGKPVISVVIPAYNEEKLLSKCLTSIKNQTFSQPYEIIVVDNNSTDHTAKIARSFKVRVVSEKRKGISAARQKGAEAARADIIAQTDADTIIDHHWLSEIYSQLKSNPEIIGVSGPTLDENWSRNIPDRIIDFFIFKIVPLIFGNMTFRGHNFAFRKKALEKAGSYNPNVEYLDDADLWFRMRKVGKITYNPKQRVATSTRRTKSMGYLPYLAEQLILVFRIYILKMKVPVKNYR
jgi:glycosyltransferase involved in cell wall biosynthesis